MTAALEHTTGTPGFARRAQTLGGGRDHRHPRPGRRDRRHHVLRRVPRPADLPGRRARARSPARLIAEDAAVALQYSATEGMAERARLPAPGGWSSPEGRHPGAGELMVTSGGIDCMELLAKSLHRPRRRVGGGGADLPGRDHGLPRLRGATCAASRGRRRNARRRAGELLAAGCGRRSSTRSPTTRTRPACRCPPSGAHALVELAAAVRLPDPRGRRLPRAGFGGDAAAVACGRSRPTWSCRPGRSPRSSSPACGSAGRPGPPTIDRPARRRQAELRPVLRRARPADARGVRPRPGTWTAQLVASRALYARRAALIGRGPGAAHAGGHHLDPPQGGFYDLADRAGRRGHGGAVRGGEGPQGGLRARPAVLSRRGAGATQIRLAYSRVADRSH